MSYNSVGTLIVIALTSVVVVTLGIPVPQPVQTISGSDSFSLEPLMNDITNVKNSSNLKDTGFVTSAVGFRQVFLGAFLPGGLANALTPRKATKGEDNLADNVQALREDVAQIKQMLKERQDQDNYRDHGSKMQHGDRDKEDTLEFSDILGFVLLVGMSYLLLKTVMWAFAQCPETKSDPLLASEHVLHVHAPLGQPKEKHPCGSFEFHSNT